MSPGSYISSESAVESAGSSNSIDDTEIGYGMLFCCTFNTKWAYILIFFIPDMLNLPLRFNFRLIYDTK